MVEAMRYGCIPLLPERLSYPEILPKDFHGDFLYRTQSELEEKLKNVILNYKDFIERAEKLAFEMNRYSWEHIIKEYDCELDQLGQDIMLRE